MSNPLPVTGPIVLETINESTNESLLNALGPTEEELTPGNKFWILFALYFKPVGKYQWKHTVLGDEILWFDIENDSFISLISRVFKAGYKSKQDDIKPISGTGQ